MGKLLNRYRPELHYMRGPGPRWHEKNTGTSTVARVEPQETGYPPQRYQMAKTVKNPMRTPFARINIVLNALAE